MNAEPLPPAEAARALCAAFGRELHAQIAQRMLVCLDDEMLAVLHYFHELRVPAFLQNTRRYFEGRLLDRTHALASDELRDMARDLRQAFALIVHEQIQALRGGVSASLLDHIEMLTLMGADAQAAALADLGVLD